MKKIQTKTVSKQLKKQWSLLAVLLLVIFSLTSVAVFAVINKNSNQPEKIQNEDQSQNESSNIPAHYIRRQLDGVYVEPMEADSYPIAVILDNDPNARPQAGLSQAQLVYEAKVESGITRLMAVFTNIDDIKEIGSVRSARPYFLDWAEGLDALFVHVGGSPKALTRIVNENILNLNEFFQGKYFWRSDNFRAPHNAYTSGENILKYLERIKAEHKNYDSWQYKEDAKEDKRAVEQEIAIDYSVFDFNVRWVYNKDENNYIRYLGGILHKDRNEAQIIAKNIVILYVNSEVLDTELRRKLDTIGSDKAIYCFDGKCEEGIWRKTAIKSREKIYDSNNQEVKFNAGVAWMQIVQKDVAIIYN